MQEGDGQFPRISVQQLKGLNERRQLSQTDDGEFDVLINAIPTNQGTLTKPPGVKQLATFSAPVWAIWQTNDANRNVIVQTRDNVQVMTEEELFGITPFVPALTPYVPPPPVIPVEFNGDDELYPMAIIMGSSAVAPATGNTYYPIAGSIISQTNPDGTAANFVSLNVSSTANSFNLIQGTYRIRGWTTASSASATDVARHDASSALAGLNGGFVGSVLDTREIAVANKNTRLFIDCAFTVPTTKAFYIGISHSVPGTLANAFGAVITGFNFTRSMLWITKTS